MLIWYEVWVCLVLMFMIYLLCLLAFLWSFFCIRDFCIPLFDLPGRRGGGGAPGVCVCSHFPALLCTLLPAVQAAWSCLSGFSLLAESIEATEGSGLPITQAVSANQDVTNDILHEKPEDWRPCSPDKLKHSNRTSLVDSELNLQHQWQYAFDRHQPQSNEANYAHLNTGFRLKPSRSPLVSTVQHTGQTESLWESNREVALRTQYRNLFRSQRGFHQDPTSSFFNAACEGPSQVDCGSFHGSVGLSGTGISLFCLQFHHNSGGCHSFILFY